MRVVAGVTACNEERTIGPLLDALLAARPLGEPIEQVVVVSSACTDGTDRIVAEVAARDPRVTLVSEPVRRGKVAAINAFLDGRPEGTDVTVIASADVLPEPGAVEAIVAAIGKASVGMAGGRPVPQNEGDALIDRMARLLWHLHDRMARKSPKLGELVAFRSRLVGRIDPESPLDEAALEAQVVHAGGRLAYVPDAVVANRGPSTYREWMWQRRRNAFGHRWLKERRGYVVSTGPAASALSLWLREIAPVPSRWLPGAALVAAEAAARLLASWDRARGYRGHSVWPLAPTTKTGPSRRSLEP